MIGRVYVWRRAYWRVLTRWSGKGPRNVLIERVRVRRGEWIPVNPPEQIVRPFRGLRRIREE